MTHVDDWSETGIHPDNVAATTVEVWSDMVCPFCYLGITTLYRAIEAMALPVRVRHRSFVLHPDIPPGAAPLASDWLSQTHGVPPAQLASTQAQLLARGAALGLEYRFETARMVATRDAHRVLHLATQRGRGAVLLQHLFRAEFTQGSDLSSHETLADLAAAAGLPRQEVMGVLSSTA